MEWDKTEKELWGALCNFCNSASDPFPPASDWDAEVRNNLHELCVAYNEWHKWLKATKGDKPRLCVEREKFQPRIRALGRGSRNPRTRFTGTGGSPASFAEEY